MVKKNIFRIVSGIFLSIAILAAGFYFFLFANPIHLHQANLLKWIPILLCFGALFASGKINTETPAKYLPFLFIPFVIFDLFNFFYFPFIIVLIAVGILALVISRTEVTGYVKLASILSVSGIFVYYLLAQPLIIERDGFGRNMEGELVNATVLWNPLPDGLQALPSHTLVDENNNEYTLESVTGKTHFIAFWATWCGPCIEKKPLLDSLKLAYQEQVEFIDISLDEDRDKWQAFLEKHDPAGMQLISNNINKTRRDLNISSLPLHFIVNPEREYKSYTSLEQAGEVLKTSIE
jgi:thiol-disulfide isomerase/thioredoxin